MPTPSTNPQDIIQAAAMTPAFQGAFQAAPPSITVDGKQYERDACRNVREQIWYLAALSISSKKGAKAVMRLAHQGVIEMARGFDESQVTTDPDVVSALQAQADAQAALTKAAGDLKSASDALKALQAQQRIGQAQVQNDQRALDSWTQQYNEVQGGIQNPLAGGTGDVVSKLLLIIPTGGLNLAVNQADLAIKADKIGGQLTGARAQLERDTAALNTLNAAIAAAQDAVKAAQANVAGARGAKDDADRAVTRSKTVVRTRLRQAEEQARQEQQQELAQEAADRNYQASSYGDSSSSDGGYGDGGGGDYITPDWSNPDGIASTDGSDLGDYEWWDANRQIDPTEHYGVDLDEQADLWGDEDYARAMCDATDEPIIGVNTVVSPWSFDRYYQGYDLESDPVWGADTGTVVTAIIAGVLAAAPAVIKAVAPPPSKDQTGADVAPGAGTQVDLKPALKAIGLDVDGEAQKAGNAAGENVSNTVRTALIVGGIGLAVLIIATRKKG